MYKIIDIQHSGRFGQKGTARIDGRYPRRIGRTVTDETVNNSTVGRQLILEYVTDENGLDYSDKVLCCSKLMRKSQEKNKVILETRNTIYCLEKVNG